MILFIFIVFVALTSTLYSPNKPILSSSQEVVSLITSGDSLAAERYIKNHYHPKVGGASADEFLDFIKSLQKFDVKSTTIEASGPTEAIIHLESKSKGKTTLSLKIEDDSPYMIQSLQEIQPGGLGVNP